MKKISILLVEDEVIIAMFMKKQIINIGYTISDHVTTGENAIISTKKNPPDLILMDIRLAGKIDGIETALLIRSEFDIPIIFISGYENQTIKNNAKKVNPLAYLSKPLNENTFKTIINNYFK